LRHLVVRSGIEVYGRRRGAVTRPDELVTPAPSSPFGRSLLDVEDVGVEAGLSADVPVTALRFAPVLGPSFPSPLGRYLRLPVVPVSALGELPFSLLHQEDAAEATTAALFARHHGPINVVGPGAVLASQAARMGGRVPLPIAGPAWLIARVAAELLSAPLPAHVRELLVRGRTADATLSTDVLGLTSITSTADVVKQLYDWGTVTYLDVEHGAAA
jgi:UDP-glucose 4-epimerase